MPPRVPLLLILLGLLGCGAPGGHDHDHDHDKHEEGAGGERHPEGDHADHDKHEEEAGGERHPEGDHADHEGHEEADPADHKGHDGHDDHEDGVVRLDPAAAAASGVRVEAAARRPLLPELRTTGRVAFNENLLAHVGPRSEGRVAEVKADLGARLQAGQTVAIIDSVELGRARASYLGARADLEVAQAALDREEALLKEKITSQAEVLGARAAFERARARTSAAAETLRVLGLGAREIESLDFGSGTPGRVALRAPFAGTLVERHLQRGEFVSPEDTLFTVADLSSLWIWIDVYERDLSRVHKGDEARVTVEAWPDRSWTGIVTYLRDAVDPDSRTVRARIEVGNPDGALRPEMFASVQLLDPHHDDATEADVLAVPDAALQRGGEGNVLFVQTAPGTYEQRPIQIGHRSGGFAEVLSGLEAGEQVVVAGSFLLKTEASRESLGGGHTH